MTETELSYLPFDLERCVCAMTMRLQDNLHAAGIDLPHSQYAVMRELYGTDGLSQAQLARKLRKDTAAIKRTVDNLEKKEFIKREAASGRDYKVTITDVAVALESTIYDIASQTRSEIFAGISNHELDMVKGFIMKITANLENDSR